jgi:alanyl-tRNA synthetase
LATRTRDLVRLVCARSADLPIAANTLLQPVCEQLGGRSGGKPEFAQGSGSRVAELERAMAEAVAALTV